MNDHDPNQLPKEDLIQSHELLTEESAAMVVEEIVLSERGVELLTIEEGEIPAHSGETGTAEIEAVNTLQA